MKNNKTLREKVYRYLRQELTNGGLRYESHIDQNKICEKLKISRAPLRDALIQLEAERFIQILPRRGVRINRLTAKDVMDTYGVIAAIESFVVASVFNKFKTRHIEHMEALNQDLYEMLESEQYEKYYHLNLQFHDVFLSLSKNDIFRDIVYPLKQRLYDFPRMQYDREWELANLAEHQRFVHSVKAGNLDAAVAVIRNEHWDFNLHKEKIYKVYGFNSDSA
jgi:DNA-binding GntR family transcriptional regulator